MLIRERQDEYYRVLGQCDKAADSGAFIEYMMQAIYDALMEVSKTEQVTVQVTEQVESLLTILGNEEMSTKEMMAKMGLKHRPTFRDNYLLPALQSDLIEMTIPDKPNSSNQRYRKA